MRFNLSVLEDLFRLFGLLTGRILADIMGFDIYIETFRIVEWNHTLMERKKQMKECR